MSFAAQASRVVSAITRHNDIAMVALLVIVITLMIVPLPTPLVDTLIGANLTISFLMLMMAMYVKTPLEFSAFPTMLLFTTLFRVGLNITTTRLILLQADAGEIIFTFGEFATGSNFVVGAVVFLILTVVQFLVIAKGAERVAEVGARFTLDAMPGKQMSIDADLRAGVIDMAEAQKRRADVQMESKMYGAMDGAMKFVKGDSIAGMVVTVINIIGGTIIGVTQRGMSAGDALQLYGVLTIGDGLVSQIPSLLVSISAGILITRSGDTREDVGAQVGRQFFSQPRALQMAGGRRGLRHGARAPQERPSEARSGKDASEDARSGGREASEARLCCGRRILAHRSHHSRHCARPRRIDGLREAQSGSFGTAPFALLLSRRPFPRHQHPPESEPRFHELRAQPQ